MSASDDSVISQIKKKERELAENHRKAVQDRINLIPDAGLAVRESREATNRFRESVADALGIELHPDQRR